MENFFSFLNSNPNFKKIEYNHLTLIEYNCPLQQEYVPIWTPQDYVVYIISGKKTWHTTEGKISLQQGDTAYIKKGGHIIHQHFDDNFCLLLFFVSDEIKNELLVGEAAQLVNPKMDNDPKIIYPIKSNPMLDGFFLSILAIFKMNKPPVDEIKKLKILEFIYILKTEPENLSALQNMLTLEHYSMARLKTIMGQNYMYNLTLKDFAELCNRSPSSFRRDFANCYHTTLSKWLISMRLNYAKSLLVHTNLSISQITLESGFENLSHFSQSFKQHFQCTPSECRLRSTLNTTPQ